MTCAIWFIPRSLEKGLRGMLFALVRKIGGIAFASDTGSWYNKVRKMTRKITRKLRELDRPPRKKRSLPVFIWAGFCG